MFGHLAEQRCCQVHGRAVATVTYGQLARLRLGVRDQFVDGACREGRISDKHERDRGQHAHRLQVLQRIEGHLRIETGIGCERARRADAQGVAVRRRLGHNAEADVAACAGSVIHHDLLAEIFGQPRHDHAHHCISAATGRKSDDDVDRLAGVISSLGANPASRGRRMR